jgi:3-methylfumaryl-CoA hydratase
VRSTITQGDRIVLVEDKDIVYRPGDSRLETPGTRETGDETTPGSGDILLTPDPVLLFRFSAVTYNSHRIHYDAPYAALEGYPGLVVHGPLQVLLMAERLRRDGISFTGRVFSYRLMAPAFSGTRLVVSREDGDGAIGARVHDGRRSTAAATLTEQEDVTDHTPASDGPRASSSQ